MLRMGPILIGALTIAGLSPALRAQYSALPAKPPAAPVRPVTDDYYGTKVTDNYRYMENLKDPEVQAWMRAQNAYTRAVLASIPGREKLLARIRELDQTVPSVGALRLPGDFYLIQKLLPRENTFKLYLRHGINGKDELLVDPAAVKLAEANQAKGANVILAEAVSNDARYLAVVIAPGGALDDSEIHVFDTKTKTEPGDGLSGDFSSWLPDNRSLLYEKDVMLLRRGQKATSEPRTLCYLHVMGTDPAKDRAVFGYGVVPSITVGPDYAGSVTVQPNSKYAIGSINNFRIMRNRAYYVEPVGDLGKTNSAWQKVADLSDDVGNVVVHGDDLYLLTYKNALSYKVLRTDARHPDLATAETVVPESRAVVTEIHPAQDALYVELLDGGINRLLRVSYGPNARTQEIALPMKGTLGNLDTDPRIPGAIFTLTSWTQALTVYAYDPRMNIATNTGLQPAGPYDHPANLESKEVKVRSYDGTLVPLSIVYPKGVKLDGSNPTLLSGYGAYGIVIPPRFAPALFLSWYEQGGIYAECHVRGGGEYGEEWHLAGKGPTKPNTWRDFIACAEYLIQHKYTSPSRLAGEGTSAGGILIGRAITSRPDLFAAAIDWVGLSDTLRFETTANGVPNIPEFGSVKTKAGFDALYAMSAYAHAKDGTKYPAVLLMTGANDPRVDPWQMDKMAARLQAATSSGKPVLLGVSYRGGHDTMGGTEAEFQETLADQTSFLLWQLGVPEFQPKP